MKSFALSRRSFLAAASAACVAGRTATLPAAEPARRIPVGVQLWTLRRETAEDVPGTLRKVSEIGYQGVELWFQKWPDATELKKMLGDCNLQIASAHVNLKDMLDDFPRMADYHRTLGNRVLVVPYLAHTPNTTAAEWQKTVDNLRHAARTANEAGFQFLYHNHDFEFKTRLGDAELLDVIFGTIDQKLMGAEIDVFFAADVGRDPAALLRKFAGRLKRVHLKDKAKPDEKSRDTELGRGVIDWSSVLTAAADAGTEWYLVEQSCDGRSALESIRISYQFLRERGVVS
jgi:sugar phosphate isomerase/epimerase